MNKKNFDASIKILKVSRMQRFRKWIKVSLASIVVFLVMALIAIPPAIAQNVPICDALTLYGNAAEQGLCKSLSPATQNLWVCDLTGTSPDIHTTFNADTNLHFTVRIPPVRPTCEGNSYLTGRWNAQQQQLTFQPIQRQQVCGVNLVSYLTRLNAIRPLYGCQQAFVEAINKQKITESVKHSYIQKCNENCG